MDRNPLVMLEANGSHEFLNLTDLSDFLERHARTERERKRRKSGPSIPGYLWALPGIPYSKIESDSIRLLKIHRIDLESRTVIATLNEHSVDDLPRFFAISYTWVSPIHEDYIQKNDSTIPERRMSLYVVSTYSKSTSLYDRPKQEPALSSLDILGHELLSQNLSDFFYHQQPNIVPDTNLWIDAICINQSDKNELACQILLMGKIYSLAFVVVAWLGRYDYRVSVIKIAIKSILPALRESMKRFTSPEEQAKWLSGCDPFYRDFWIKEMRLDTSPEIHWPHFWLSYCEFFITRQWFSRAWVVQEVVLATKVTITAGSDSILLEELNELECYMSGASWFDQLYTNRRTSIHLPNLIMWYHSGHLNKFRQTRAHVLGSVYFRPSNVTLPTGEVSWSESLLHLLETIRHQQSTHPEDKIHSIIGMLKKVMPEKDHHLLRSNFTNGQEAYIWACKLLIDQSVYEVLGSVEDRSRTKLCNIPSWVADWSCSSPDTPVTQSRPPYLPYNCTKAWSDNDTQIPVVHGDVLHIYGKQYGTCQSVIQWANTALVERSEYDRFCLYLIDILEAWKGLHITEYGKDSAITAILAVLVFPGFAQKLSEPEEVETFKRGLKLIADFVTAIPMSGGTRRETAMQAFASSSTSISPRNSDIYAFLNHVLTVTLGDQRYRPLFVTDLGHLGSGTRSTQVDDEVWLVPKVPFPLLLRPTGLEDEYTLVGSAYIHGMMYGELQKEEGENFQNIHIV